MVHRVVGNEDQIRRLRARQIRQAPRIDLNHLSGVLDPYRSVHERRNFDIAAGGRNTVGGSAGPAMTTTTTSPNRALMRAMIADAGGATL
jgi:hypothetical protein